MRIEISKIGKLFCREPYRLFFPLGILMGIYGVSHWLFYALGWSKTASGFFHSSIQMQGYMSCFILGFLLTAMPRFASAPHATARELFSFLVLTLGIPVFLSLGGWVFAEIFFVLWLLAIARFAASRFFAPRETKVSPPTEFVWIPIGILHGILGSLFLALGNLTLVPAWVVAVGKPMMLQGFLFSIVLGVGGFLGPRLMGIPQLISPENIKKEEVSKTQESIEMIRGRRIRIHLVAGILLFASFWMEGFGLNRSAYFLRALVVTFEFAFTKALGPPPRVHHLFAWILWISFWMVALGSLLVAIFPQYRIAMLHFVFLGGFGLMTFAVGTVVVLSHGGEVGRLYKPLPILAIVLGGVLLALASRVFADFFPQYYFNLLGVAAVIWLTAAIGWFFYILPKIFRVPGEGTFDREHSIAKDR